ncbi:hypothetical protein [Bacillus phage vB_BanS-Thrax1]|nr:hypothetical protein [Bacillus phage vB_BanS-Thrax1]
MEFKKGDKVKIIMVRDPYSLGGESVDNYIGATGVIKDVDPEYQYPYEIKFDELDTPHTLWGEDEIGLISEDLPEEAKEVVKSNPNQFLYYNDTQRTVRIHPATKSHGTECNMNDILAGEMRMFYLPEGTYAWTKMWDYGGEHGLQLLVSPTPFTVEEMQAKKNADRIDDIINMLKRKDVSIIDVFEALHNLKKWVN